MKQVTDSFSNLSSTRVMDIDKPQINNSAVMSFLVNNRCLVAAEAFHLESGCPMGINNVNLLATQLVVRYLLRDRQYNTAIDALNALLGVSFLQDRPLLHYTLQKQWIIELRYRCNFIAGYEFAITRFIDWTVYPDIAEDIDRIMWILFDSHTHTNPLPNSLMDELRRFDYKPVITEMRSFQGNSIEKVIQTLKADKGEQNEEVGANFG